MSFIQRAVWPAMILAVLLFGPATEASAQCAKCSPYFPPTCQRGPLIGGYSDCFTGGSFCFNVEPQCGPPTSFNALELSSFGLLAASPVRALMYEDGTLVGLNCFGAIVTVSSPAVADGSTIDRLSTIVI